MDENEFQQKTDLIHQEIVDVIARHGCSGFVAYVEFNGRMMTIWADSPGNEHPFKAIGQVLLKAIHGSITASTETLYKPQ